MKPVAAVYLADTPMVRSPGQFVNVVFESKRERTIHALLRKRFNQGVSRSRTPSGAGRASLSIEPQTFDQEAHLTAPNTSGGVRG
jgi:hypothetical protein